MSVGKENATAAISSALCGGVMGNRTGVWKRPGGEEVPFIVLTKDEVSALLDFVPYHRPSPPLMDSKWEEAEPVVARLVQLMEQF